MTAEKLGVLASGRGSNFQAILENIELGVLQDVEAELLISDNPDAGALEVAEEHGVESRVIEPGEGKEGRREFEGEVHRIFENADVSLVILAGFMRIVSPHLIGKYRGKIMNIHPSLLPSFKGLNAQKQALEHGAKVTGCTIHYAEEDLDAGPIILQHPVPVKEGDTEGDLSDRVLIFEHRLYSKAIQLHADERLEIEDCRVKIDYGGNWEEKWKERQKDFVEHQKESWERNELFEGIWK